MLTKRRLFLVTAIIFSGLTLSQAQQSSTPSAPVVTASGSAERVRFTAPSNVVRMQLQVFSEDGQVLFDVNSKGNVLDWSLQDSSGQRLFGTYLTVITVKTLSGRVSQRIGSVSLGEKQGKLPQLDTIQLSVAQQQALGPVEENATLTILKTGEAQAATVVANNGNDGLINRDHGALSFRIGDFFSANDQEQMRLTEEGNLGIGTNSPQAKLDVAGVIRTSKGIEFENGTKLTTTATGGLQQTMADGTVVANVMGTGTQNQVAKWAETGGAGTLTDSTITETGGLVGIGITNPTYKLVVGPDIGPGLTTSDLTISRGPGQSVSIFAGASGANGMNFGWDQGNLRAFVNAPVQSPITFTHGGVSERMRIATNGNVGIGTNNPATTLDVTGDVNTSTQYNISGNRVLSVAGTNNTFAGVGAGASNTGQVNAFFGTNAGNANTGGLANAFFGSRAGFRNTTASNNSFFGENAGEDNTTGAINSFFGSHAGQNNTTGGGNSFFGASAADANTTGFNNSFFGNGSGSRNTTAGNNSFFGQIAGTHNTTGEQNAFFGQNAGTSNTTGSNNSFFGQSAGQNNTTGSSSIFIGTSSGLSNTVEDNNTFIGTAANGADGITNATAIGSNASVTQSNSLVLGSINTVNGATSNTNVGIGIPNPSSVLHIVSQAEQLITASTSWNGGTWFSLANTDTGGRTWNLISSASTNGEGAGKLLVRDATANAVRMTFDTDGDVGIGVTGPVDKLQVAGDIRVGTGTTGCVKDADATILTGTCSSDARFKRNITPFPKLLDQLVRLQPVHFYWRATEYPDKAFGKSESFGLIAQEVEKVLPELVTEDEKGFKAVRYHELPLMMLQAIKEQQTQIRQQQTEIEKQQAEMTGQRSQIEVLKHLVCLDHPSADVCR